MAISHLYPNIRPSLDLNFAATKRLDPRITFSRSSSGTYFDANGVLQTAATNVARFDHNPSTGESLGLLVEEARTNALPYSQQLTNAYWDNNAGIVAIPNSALAPDQTYTALLVRQDTSTSEHRFANSLNVSPLSNGQLSIFVKPNGCRYVGLSQNTESYVTTVFDLNNGTVVSGAGQIVNCGNGWYRISESRGEYSYRPNFHLLNAAGSATKSFTGDGTSGVWIWGFQKESGSFPTSYIPTPATFTSRASSATYYDANGVIQTASTNVARSAAFFPDSNGVMRPAGLLLEAAGTNLLQYSEQLNTSPWTLNNSASVSANSSVSPDGQTTADTLSGAATNSYAEQTIPWSASGNWTLSFFAKAGTSVRNKIYIVRSDSQVHGTNIDWSSGVPSFSTTFGCTAQSEKIGNGWYRISLLLASVDHTATNFLRITSDFISGTGTVLLWGFQAEQNPYPTSYIPTTSSTVTRSADVSSSATVTRSADVAQITGANFSSWYNQSEGTILTGISNAKKSGRIFEINDNTDSNRHLVAWTSTGDNFASTIGGNTFFNAVTSTSANPRLSAFAYKSALYAGVSNGGTAVTSSFAATPIVSQMYIGGPIGSGSNLLNYANGTLSRLTYWPTRLSDATLQTITR